MRGTTDIRPSVAKPRLLLASVAVLALAACQHGSDGDGSQEMAWARAALERNPNLELLATDMDAGVFTVRVRPTGQVHAVRVDELAAVPIAEIVASAPAGGGVPAAAPAAADEPVQDATFEDPDSEPAIAATDTPGPSPAPGNYTIERAGGQVRVVGPGVSIVSAGATPPPSAKGEPGQRTVDPIVCDGPRTMHLDGRSIYVEGDAITVLGGCALYITNSRIVASATGVVAREGVVHIDNSYVEGATASFDVEGDVRMYLRGSTFQGLMRRDATAMIEDRGGNRGLPTL